MFNRIKYLFIYSCRLSSIVSVGLIKWDFSHFFRSNQRCNFQCFIPSLTMFWQKVKWKLLVIDDGCKVGTFWPLEGSLRWKMIISLLTPFNIVLYLCRKEFVMMLKHLNLEVWLVVILYIISKETASKPWMNLKIHRRALLKWNGNNSTSILSVAFELHTSLGTLFIS